MRAWVMCEGDAMRASLVAEMKAGRVEAALRQMTLTMARMMRGQQGVVVSAMKMNMAEAQRVMSMQVMQQASEGRVLGYRFKGQRFDCGSVEGFVKATNYCFASS